MNQASHGKDRAKVRIGGPERATLVERAVGVFRLPYIVGCVILAFVFGVVVEMVAVYAPVGNQVDALAPYFVPQLTWRGITFVSLGFLMFLSMLLLIRFTRVQVKKAEEQLVPSLPGGEAEFHHVFRLAFSYRWHILLFLLFFGLSIPTLMQFESNSVGRAEMVFGTLFATFVLSCQALVYLGSVFGLYQLSRTLRLRSYGEDPKLGTRPVASLSLSLSSGYFSVVAIMIILTAVAPYAALRAPTMITIEVLLVLGGMVMFFLPIYRIHLRMEAERARQLSTIRHSFDDVSYELKKEKNEDSLVKIERILSLDMAYRMLQQASTWPFETSMLGRFAAVSLSVVATLIARIVIAALRI